MLKPGKPIRLWVLIASMLVNVALMVQLRRADGQTADWRTQTHEWHQLAMDAQTVNKAWEGATAKWRGLYERCKGER